MHNNLFIVYNDSTVQNELYNKIINIHNNLYYVHNMLSMYQ
jgi:hypothetical protein